MVQEDRLQAGLAQLEIKANKQQIKQTLHWLLMLEHWNQVYNLTRFPKTTRMTHLVFMSIAILPYVRAPRVLDVGTGAGVPGLLLAIFAPTLQLTLIDSTLKKILFLRQVVIELELKNVEIIHRRVADVEASPYQTIVARAFSNVEKLLAETKPLAEAKTRWITWLGEEKIKQIDGFCRDDLQCKLHSLKIPELEQAMKIALIKQ
ncbi:MAG: 16S rRNA (guanine(527)-N(7))-methyltransferase RsmG [Candidatus Oxydemutatoraceae bacterium WSBS_2016_MAG_OTU14]